MEKLLTLGDLAEVLGVPKQTIYAWRRRRHGPRAVAVGRHLRFRPADVEAWLEEQPARSSPAKRAS
jgi:excisionase family DNA binding protein